MQCSGVGPFLEELEVWHREGSRQVWWQSRQQMGALGLPRKGAWDVCSLLYLLWAPIYPPGSGCAHPGYCSDPGSLQMCWKRAQVNLTAITVEWPATGGSSLQIPLLGSWFQPCSTILCILSECSLFAFHVPITLTLLAIHKEYKGTFLFKTEKLLKD